MVFGNSFGSLFAYTTIHLYTFANGSLFQILLDLFHFVPFFLTHALSPLFPPSFFPPVPLRLVSALAFILALISFALAFQISSSS